MTKNILQIMGIHIIVKKKRRNLTRILKISIHLYQNYLLRSFLTTKTRRINSLISNQSFDHVYVTPGRDKSFTDGSNKHFEFQSSGIQKSEENSEAEISDDDLVDFKFIEDIDSKLKNEHETKIKFNIDYIFSLIDEFQSMDELEEWDMQVDEPHLKVWISKYGSFMNSDIPVIHTEIRLRKRYPFQQIVNAVNDASQKQIWDKNIKSINVLKKFASNGIIYHTVFKSASKIIPERDFVEK